MVIFQPHRLDAKHWRMDAKMKKDEKQSAIFFGELPSGARMEGKYVGARCREQWVTKMSNIIDCDILGFWFENKSNGVVKNHGLPNGDFFRVGKTLNGWCDATLSMGWGLRVEVWKDVHAIEASKGKSILAPALHCRRKWGGFCAKIFALYKKMFYLFGSVETATIFSKSELVAVIYSSITQKCVTQT